MSIASLIIAVAAVLFSVGSAWWLYGYRGRLVATKPPRFALLHNGGVLLLRIPLAVRNTGGRSLVVLDLRCWFPETTQVLPLPWRRTTYQLLPKGGEADDAPLPFSVRGHDSTALLVEFGAPFPGFAMHSGTYRVRIEALPADRLEWDVLIMFDLKVEARNLDLDNYSIYENLNADEYTIQRVDEASRRFGRELKDRLGDPPEPPE
jgi:hypothetical protein